MDHQKIWELIKLQLATQLPPAKMGAWVEPVSTSLTDDCLCLSVPSPFFVDGLKADCEDKILAILKSLNLSHLTLSYAVDSSIELFPTKQKETPKHHNIDGFIDERFTFENFVVGSSNEFCHAASLAVAEQPGAQYNPCIFMVVLGLVKPT